MSIPFLLGPVETGASFMLASLINGQPNILNGVPVTGGLIYYWEPNINTINIGNTLPIFTTQGPLNSLTLNDTVNSGGVAFASDGVTIGNAPQSAQLIMSQFTYANWWPPDIFLSMATYTIYNSSGATAYIRTLPSTTGPTGPANNVIILPVLWYYACTSSGSYNYINEPLDSILNWFCLANSGTSGCSGTSVVPSGWTNIDDCVVGNNYTYCPAGQNCGNSDCKGPCPVIYDDCNYKSSALAHYICQFNPLNYFVDVKWWETPYFIGAVISIIVIIIVLIIVIFAVARHGNKVSEPPLGGYNSFYIND